MLHFERVWPKLYSTPYVKNEFSKSAVTVKTYSGLIYVSFCASFNTNITIDKVSGNAYKYTNRE